jgi:hypothetical protein
MTTSGRWCPMPLFPAASACPPRPPPSAANTPPHPTEAGHCSYPSSGGTGSSNPLSSTDESCRGNAGCRSPESGFTHDGPALPGAAASGHARKRGGLPAPSPQRSGARRSSQAVNVAGCRCYRAVRPGPPVLGPGSRAQQRMTGRVKTRSNLGLPRTGSSETRPGRSRWARRTPLWRVRWASISSSIEVRGRVA